MMLKRLAFVGIVTILIIGCIIYFLISSTPYKIKSFSRDLFGAKQIEDEKTKANIKDFTKSSLSITIEAIHAGDLRILLSNPLNLKHIACKGIENQQINIPFFAYLIHHEKYGYFLIDSGCSSSYENKPYGPMKGLILKHVMPETHMKKGQAIDLQISKVYSKISYVFFTHLHFDHTSGLPSLQDNLMMFAGKGERSFYIPGILEPNHFKKKSTVYMMNFDRDYTLDTPIGKAIDIFGDHSFWAISTPGHSKGHVSYMVNTVDGPVLVAGDAVTMNKCLELGVASGTSSKNPKQDQETLEKIISFSEKNPQLKILPGHDYTCSNSLQLPFSLK